MKTALFAALALLAAGISAQQTETGGAAGYAATPSATTQGVRRLDAAWASNNHVRASAYFEDYDGDTLENWAEAVLGTSPWTNDVSGVSVATAKSIGAFDLVPGAWKAAHGLSSPLSWSEDHDNDGWDNWSEWMAGTDPNAATNRPNPTLAVTLDYHATLRGRLVIWAYSRFDMNGWPDAVYARNVSLVALPATVELTDADLVHGHLRQGANWFFAWVGSGSGSPLPSWINGDPAAVADNQFDGINIGFDLNEIAFHLTDKAESFARFSWQRAMPAGDDVHVAILSGGNPVFDRVIKWPRTWLHEGDIISWNQEHSGYSRKNFGLGAQEGSLTPNNEVARSFVTVLTPQRDYEAEQWSTTPFCEITNWVHDVSESGIAKPVLYGPMNYEIVAAARPEFKFSLDPEFTEFRFRLITRVDESGEWTDANRKTLYDERVLAPGRFRNDITHERDLVILKSPLAVGDTWTNGIAFEAGKTYLWAVNAFSPGKKSGTTTVSENFVTAASSGWGIRYRYAAPLAYSSALRVQAHDSPACAAPPAASVRHGWSATGSGWLRGLPGPGPWFVRGVAGCSAYGEGGDFTAAGFVGGRRPVPVYAEPCGSPSSITNDIVIRDAR
jgi:hypothetical protein